jgi:hypothetical protein
MALEVAYLSTLRIGIEVAAQRTDDSIMVPFNPRVERALFLIWRLAFSGRADEQLDLFSGWRKDP